MTCILQESNKELPVILKIPDELWDKIKVVLPIEKPFKTIGRPIVSYRKVLDGILYILRTGCQWKMLPKEYGSGSTCHRRFQEWNRLDLFKKIWVKLLTIYDDLNGINWTWHSLDSISIKSPLGGRKLEIILQTGANWAQKDTF
jgi:transposase